MPDRPLAECYGGSPAPAGEAQAKTWPQVRHDIRNYLNAIKLSCAVLRRRGADEMADELLGEIDRASDAINELITHHPAP